MAIDTGQAIQVTAGLGSNGCSLFWSPDGSELGYLSSSPESQSRIVKSDGSGDRAGLPPRSWLRPNVTRTSPPLIVFESDVEGDFDLYVSPEPEDASPPSPAHRTHLTDLAGDEGQAAWSPNGQFVVFVSNRDGDNEIYITQANGSGRSWRLTNSPAEDTAPVWQP